jgi:hypothetical protein
VDKKFNRSIASGKKLVRVFSLGDLYVSDFLPGNQSPKSPPIEHALAFDKESKLAQLTAQASQEVMWGDSYWYRSGTNKFMSDALYDVAVKTVGSTRYDDGDVYIDIASNDGTLLSHVKTIAPGLKRVGIDPSMFADAMDKADVSIRDYFSALVYKNSSLGDKRAKFISCCAMFYDLQKPVAFLKDIHQVLAKDGIFTLQLSYTPLMVIQNDISNICSEHIAYYTLASLKYVLSKAKFRIMDAELNNVNGGSIRLYCVKKSFDENYFRTAADRDIARIRIDSLGEWESKESVNTIGFYKSFYKKALSQKGELLKFFKQEIEAGKTVWGYGASTKGNTFLQWAGIAPYIIKIADRQERKHGLFTVGTNIEVCSEEEMRKAQPDYLFIFPWHFISEFKEREKEYLDKGGKFIVTSPRFEIIE